MVKKILPLMPDCKRYVEVFGGGASVLLARPPVELELYNDLDSGLYDFFTVLADEQLFKKFYRRVEALPCSRQFYNEYRSTWRDQEDMIERTARWFLVARQSFSGDFGAGWGSVVTASRNNMAETSSKWIGCLKMLPEIHQRLLRVQIENADFRDIISRYDTDDTLFYCDPPYVHSTRKAGGYEHEMTDEDHLDFIEMIKNTKGSVVISGYANDIYELSDEFVLHEFETACHVAGRTKASGIQGKGSALKMQPRTECVWVKDKSGGKWF